MIHLHAWQCPIRAGGCGRVALTYIKKADLKRPTCTGCGAVMIDINNDFGSSVTLDDGDTVTITPPIVCEPGPPACDISHPPNNVARVREKLTQALDLLEE